MGRCVRRRAKPFGVAPPVRDSGLGGPEIAAQHSELDEPRSKVAESALTGRNAVCVWNGGGVRHCLRTLRHFNLGHGSGALSFLGALHGVLRSQGRGAKVGPCRGQLRQACSEFADGALQARKVVRGR